jgi:hypothetical protein
MHAHASRLDDLETDMMWQEVRQFPGTAEQLLHACFYDETFLRAYHEDQAHTNLELSPWRHEDNGTSARTLSFQAPALVGSVRVTEALRCTLGDGGASLLVDSRSTLSGGGPAERLRPIGQWRFANGTLTVRVEVDFEPNGYAERLLASTVQVVRVLNVLWPVEAHASCAAIGGSSVVGQGGHVALAGNGPGPDGKGTASIAGRGSP